MTIDELNSRIFTECLHDTFTLIAPGGETCPLELIEVAEKPAAPGNEQFSIVFRETEGHRAPQGIYTLEHERLGRIELFLVPVDEGSGRIALEAVFNRFRPAPGPQA
jgi:hypothetical protein